MSEELKELNEDLLNIENEIEMKRAFFDVEIKASDEMKPRTVVAKISTTAVDRDGEVLLPSGIDLKDFKKNPIVLLNHDQHGLPIGKALKIKRESDGIVAEVQFAERPKDHPATVEWIPDTVFELFQQGILKAFSVGFIPADMRVPDDKDKRKFGEDVRNIIAKWKLLEFSVVNVPANQDALVQSVAKSHKWLADAWNIKEEKKENLLQETGEVVRYTIGEDVSRYKID